MARKWIFGLFLLTLTSDVWASLQGARDVYNRGNLDSSNLRTLIRELAEDKYYYSSVSFILKILSDARAPLVKELDDVIEDVVARVGVKQFEVLSFEQLERSGAPTIRYILAKKYFRQGSYDNALRVVKEIPSKHALYPFALLIEGSIHSINKNFKPAISALKDCLSESGSGDDDLSKMQLQVNHDYCLVGLSRARYASGEFKEAESQYQDLPKSSYVWPEILFEEAWNSYNLGDFNRTLGKLVTYKSPFFENIFNPEVDVLRALTFYRLCLYGDSKSAVDEFYGKYENDSNDIKTYLNRHARDYDFYFEESRKSAKGGVLQNDLLTKVMRSIVYDLTYRELYRSLKEAREELVLLRNRGNDQFIARLIKNNVETINKQKQIMGSYVRRKLLLKYAQIFKSFEQMSNIKLEVLAQRKAELYKDSNLERKRGDIKYLKRSEKQYFWSFNGEFWADELGDYVFALASECRE